MKTISDNHVFPMMFNSDEYNEGLTNRELFAAMALQGLMPVAESQYGGRLDALAIDAVHAADALIEALNK